MRVKHGCAAADIASGGNGLGHDAVLTFTPAEHSLRRLGEHGRLRDLRMLFPYAEVATGELHEPSRRARWA
jgi:hypothetical protein